MSNHPLLTPLNIGDQTIANRIIVAPMAGVTDKPFRMLAKSFGAGHAVSEMMTSDATLFAHHKTLYRANFEGEIAPISAQIAGSDPEKSPKRLAIKLPMGRKLLISIWVVRQKR